ncbi:MAG: L-glutamine synthetase [candidate division WS6 bacterium 36_33]|uniref:Glutamine synthetase n=1 Tax=candidate division WS6 bacterium 36_33 TaxID=1641388 RepID=A0A101GZH5_9BACT|nr:MAG: L-glutamine synthetase [candidate division WS6 bacterium 36_33]
MDTEPTDFLSLSLKELEEKNLEAKKLRSKRTDLDPKEIEKKYKDYLKKEDGIKAVTVFFSDLEGRFHMLDYDKKYLLESDSNLTFDGSSVRGFSNVTESDLRLKLDWGSFYWLPSSIFGPGKIAMFADIYTEDHEIHPCDFRARLKKLMEELEKKDFMINVGAELEGFLLEGLDAETLYVERKGFKLVSPGGYYHSLPKDKLRLFIDSTAEVQRALGFENEKDHPEVAPSQFELNYKYADVINAADQIQLYKLMARQVAENMDCTACFLPKPLTDINGSGMHTNLSISKKGKNIFYNKSNSKSISKEGLDFTERILGNANEICLVLNSSVNSYRRLDPNFEAPNKIKYSHSDRTSMVRLPVGNEHSTRIEVRSVAPDTNPYLLIYTLLRTGLEGEKEKIDSKKRVRTKMLPSNIYDAIRVFKSSDFTTELLGEEAKERYLELKEAVANRSPKELGKTIKKSEVLYHHEITNQYLWNKF